MTTAPRLTTVNRAAYTIAETLALTGLGRDKLYSLINEGRLPAHKLGRRTLVIATDLEAFLKSLPVIGRAA
jgi:excisionase family DNA binding protein